MLSKLDGYKSYIIALLIGLTVAAQFLGYIDSETSATLLGLLGAGSVATLRDAISKLGSK